MKFKDGILEGVKVTPSPNKGGLIKPRLLIVHDTAGALNSAGSISWLCNPAAKASAHFVVGRSGDITQLVSANVKAWHAGQSSYKGVSNVNDFSVGIEFVNPGALVASGASGAKASFGAVFDRKAYGITEFAANQDPEGTHAEDVAVYGAALWMPYTQEQLNAGLAIALALRDAYGITSVARHADISPRRKIDVGPQFPLRWFRGKLEGRGDDAGPAPLKPIDEQAELHGQVVSAPSGPVVRYAQLTGLGRVHTWPSFYEDNVVARSGAFRIVDQISAVVAGAGGINELGNEELWWFKVEVGPLTDSHFGYILRSNCKLITEEELHGQQIEALQMAPAAQVNPHV